MSTTVVTTPSGAIDAWPSFDLDPQLAATAPPEARGLERDEVRLLVATPFGTRHARFCDLPDQLAAGDLLVVNTSSTLPAAVDVRRADDTLAVVHVAGPHPTDPDRWLVELRHPDGRGPIADARLGEVVTLPAGGRLQLSTPFPPSQADEPHPPSSNGSTERTPHRRVWTATTSPPSVLYEELRRSGRPIAYGHTDERWPLRFYQTVFGRVPGSAEMPSASRPFSPATVLELVTAGVDIAPIILHAGLSSLERGEPPLPERFEVPAATARRIEQTRDAGGRIVAAGTSVVRAVESVVALDGSVGAAAGWTDLLLGPDRPARVVDGLLTGWHEPDASHLELLEAVAGRRPVRDAYRTALLDGYRWHEFGDSCLLLP
ncbi:MAG: S-adenosylmethionine:tRNA ribosyltransferase-isomerase [Actinomycetota bacterium]